VAAAGVAVVAVAAAPAADAASAVVAALLAPSPEPGRAAWLDPLLRSDPPARSRREAIDRSLRLASELVCCWPSAVAVRAQCSASALWKGGAPGGAEPPGGAPEVGGEEEGEAAAGGGGSTGSKFMRALL
jgi:hypothetical protein